MFDLFRSRAKVVRYILGALLLLVALSMVVTLIPGFGTGIQTEQQVVAEVGKQVVTIQDVQRTLQAQMRGRTLPPETLAIFVPQIADQMITENALAYEAERLGFQVTEQDIANTVRTIFPQLFSGGQFAGREAYAALLAQENMTIPQFENTIRKGLLLTALRDMVSEGIVVSPQEVEDQYHLKNDKVKIEYVAFAPAKYRSEVTVTPEEIKNYFDANRTGFQVSEKRSLDVLIVDEAKVAQSITVPEAEIRRIYDQNKDSYRVPERVRVRHILLKTTDKPKDEIPKIRAQAEDLLKQLKQGADFAALAKKYSEDTGSAAKGGDLGWIVRGQTVKAFEDAAFSLKPKELSNVITTEYGFHILQVLEKQQAHVRPFDEVKAQLTEERKKQLVYDQMQDLADKARAALNKDPAAAEKVAQDLGLQLVRADKVSSGSALPEIGVSRDLDDAVSSLRKGEVSPVVQIAPTKLAVAVVTDFFPAHQADLADVEGQIRDRLASEKLAKLADQRAAEVFEKAKSLNGDLKKLAQTMGLDYKTPPEFTHDGAVEGLGSAGYVEPAFSAPVGAVLGPVTVGDRKVVYKVVAKTPADPALLAAQRDSLRQQIKDQKAQDRVALFEEGVRDDLIREGKLKINQDVINRLVSNYRGS